MPPIAPRSAAALPALKLGAAPSEVLELAALSVADPPDAAELSPPLLAGSVSAPVEAVLVDVVSVATDPLLCEAVSSVELAMTGPGPEGTPTPV